MVEYDRLIWEMVPVGIPDKNRCSHCLKTIAIIEREERELKERDYL